MVVIASAFFASLKLSMLDEMPLALPPPHTHTHTYTGLGNERTLLTGIKGRCWETSFAASADDFQVAVCCSLLQCVAVCCSVLQRVAGRDNFWARTFSKVSKRWAFSFFTSTDEEVVEDRGFSCYSGRF